MDAHNETAVAEPAEGSQVENLPDAQEPASFADAIESALSSFDEAPEAPPATEPAPEPAPEPVAETTEPEPAPETESKETLTEDSAADPDLLESLSKETGDWTPKAANRFKQLKTELKTNRTELDQLRQSLAERDAKLQEMSGLVENRDIDQLQQQLATYEHEQTFTDLENTTAYKQAVTEPLQNLLDRAGEIASKYNVESDDLIDAMAIDDQDQQDDALNGLLSEASDRDRAKIYRVIDELAPVLERRETLVHNAEAALNEALMLENQRINAEAAERASLRSNITRNVVNRVGEKLPFLKGVEGLDMNAIQEKASSVDPGTLHPVDFAYNNVAAQLLPTIVREYMTSRKEVDALTDKLADYESAEPTMSGTPAVDGVSRPASTLNFADAVEAALGG
mgnify:CR=1 FL=1